MDPSVTKGIEKGIEAFIGKYDFSDDAIVDDLRKLMTHALTESLKDRPVVTSSGKSETKRTRRKTGYNMYIKDKFEEAKSDDSQKSNSQDLMSLFSKQWSALSDEEKKPFIEKADKLNTENGAETTKSKRTGKKTLSGYNLFYRERKDAIKEELKEGEALMKVVGAKWRGLGDDEKDEYRKRAKELSSQNTEDEA